MKANSSNKKNERGKTPVETEKPASAVAAAMEAKQEISDKGPSSHAELTIQAIRALRIWQQVTADEGSRAAALDVAKLAMDLALLHGKTDPQSCLDEAARLLTEARFALVREQSRPEREQREQRNKMIGDLADEFRKNKVPFDKLCRPATPQEQTGSATALPANETFSFTNQDDKEVSFVWRIYRDERDLKELFAKHAKLIYQQAGKELASVGVSAQRDWQCGEKIVNLLASRYWLPDEWRTRLIKMKNYSEGATLISEYVLAATQAFEENLWRMAKAGELDVISLYSVYNTRQDTYKTRGPNQPKSKSANI